MDAAAMIGSTCSFQIEAAAKRNINKNLGGKKDVRAYCAIETQARCFH